MHRVNITDLKKDARAAQVPGGPVGSNAWRCLIVEDNSVCMRVAVKMMQKLGFQCEQADNGLKAVNMLKENSLRAHLVLMRLTLMLIGLFCRMNKALLTLMDTPSGPNGPAHARDERTGGHKEDP